MKKICKFTILFIMVGIITISGINIQFTNTAIVTQTSVNAATTGQKEALGEAKSYLSFMAFSKKGLIKQLKYEGYSTKEAKYAVKHCKANWKKQAKKMAKSYLKSSSFSKKRLKKQLKYEGFTNVQANYGVKHCGANWKKQAKKTAENYLEIFDFSEDELYNQLEYEGFTDAQIRYALWKVGY